MEVLKQLVVKFDVIFPHLDDPQRRLLMATEARGCSVTEGSGRWRRLLGFGRRPFRRVSMSWTQGLGR